MAFRFAGPVTMDNAQASLAACVAAIDAGAAELVLDTLARSDSSAVAVLVAARRHAEAGGKAVRFSAVPAAIASLAALYGVDAFLKA